MSEWHATDIDKLEDEITALRAEVEEAKAQEDEYMGYVATLGKALRDLSFAAQTTEGVAGRDEGLVAAIDAATYALSFVGVLKGMNLVADLRSQLSARDAEVRDLRGFAQGWFESVPADLLGHDGMVWSAMCFWFHGLVDADGNPTPLLTGEPGPGAGGDQ